MLLRDPLDDNVIPIVEELQRRLALASASFKGQGEEEEQPTGARDDAETGEENGSWDGIMVDFGIQKNHEG